MEELEGMAFEAYDRAIGLELSEVAVDCCITKAPCGGEKAGRSPVDRGKRGIKRSVAVDARGIPLGVVSAPANRHDSPLLGQTLDAAGFGFAPRGSEHPPRSWLGLRDNPPEAAGSPPASGDLGEGQPCPPERNRAMDR